MGLFRNTKGSIISAYFTLLKDIAGLKAGNAIDVALYEDHITFKDISKNEANLKYSQVTDIFYGQKECIETKKPSAMGRALVGGLIAGGTGVMLGALSAEDKVIKKKKSKIVLTIFYTSSNGLCEYISLEDTGPEIKGKKLVKQLKELCGIPDKPQELESKSVDL